MFNICDFVFYFKTSLILCRFHKDLGDFFNDFGITGDLGFLMNFMVTGDPGNYFITNY